MARATGTLATIDPYQPCRKAEELYQTERAARAAYLALGKLPTRVVVA